MSHFSEDPKKCRVDFFKPNGTWYTTEAIIFRHYRNIAIHEAFRLALEEHLKDSRLAGMTAICLAPYHENSHPIQMIIGSGAEEEVILEKCAGCQADFIPRRTINLKGIIREFAFHNKDITDRDNASLCQNCKEALVLDLMHKLRGRSKC